MIHEAQLYDDNAFITLTYSDAEIPKDYGLSKEHLTKFLKRLRHHKGPYRYYACGEYGDITQRAHYHACIFGLNFPDKKYFKKEGDHTLYTSEELNNIWGHGNTSIGELNYETAQYTAKYVMKKQLGKGGRPYYYVDEETGELTLLQQPFSVMSLRPAIAERWLRQYASDIYANGKDFIMVQGKKMRPTKYYDKIYDILDPHHMQEIKITREKKHEPITQQQMHAREKIARARTTHKQEI